ncbi:MAG: alpha/beta hydrolase [Pseudomonadota bacterium]
MRLLKVVLVLALSASWVIQPTTRAHADRLLPRAIAKHHSHDMRGFEAVYAVGMQIREFEDTSRPAWIGEGARPLSTTVWYPTSSAENVKQFEFPHGNPLFYGGIVAIGGQLDPGSRRGLVVLSHGTGRSALQLMWLGHALAKRGYIVAAVNHHGNTAAERRYDARGFRMPWERAKNVSQVLDQLLEDPVFGSKIDQSRIFAGGFSLGGYTTIALAGGRTDLRRLSRFCASEQADATCGPQREYPQAEEHFARILATDEAARASVKTSGDDLSDPRIKAFFVIAPALAQAFSDESLRAISKRFLIIEGEFDDVAPAKTNSHRLRQQLPASRISKIDGAGHFSFMAACTELGQAQLPICWEAEPTADRMTYHADAVQQIEAFLD